jgi:peptidyl-prolyl cis-trans isomerase D
MLKVFRDNLKYFSWILWIVIAAFIWFYIPDFLRTGRPTAAVTVWDQEITYSELQSTNRNLQERLRQQYGDDVPQEMAERLALNQLINNKILLREARRMGLTVSDEELSREILALPGFQGPNGKFIGEAAYRRRLRRAGLTVSDFEQSFRDQLLIDKLRTVLSDNLVVTDEELEQEYRKTTERAKIRYLQLPASRFAEDAKVTDDEVASYFEEHRESYRLPERREVAYLLVKLDQIRRDLEIDESELFAYYQEHQDSFTTEEQVRARHILLTTSERSVDEASSQIREIKKRIEGGEDFATVAKEVSEDPGSASRGGELGFFRRGQMTPEFENAAFAAEPGKLVGPVVTPFGVHLIQVEERREAGVRPFADVRNQIRARLAAEKAPEKVQERAQELEKELRALPADQLTPERLRQTAEDSGGTVVFNQPAPLARDDSIPGIGRPPQLIDAVFEMDPGALSQIIELPTGDRALVYLQQILPPRDQQLAEVRDQIHDEISSRKQEQMAVDRLAEARDELEGGKTLDQVAEELEVTPQESNEFGPQGVIQGLGYNAKVARAALSMNEGEVGGPFESVSGALLFEVVERKTWDPKQFEAQKAQLRDRLLQQRQERLFSSLILERREQLRADGELQVYDPEVRKLLGSPS